jgi:uridine kinase
LDKKATELEKRFLVPLPPLTPPRSIAGFLLVKEIPQRAETFYFDTADDKLFGRKTTLRIRIYNSEVILDCKSGEADPDKSTETSVWINKEDLEAILQGDAKIQDFFENPALLPQEPMRLTGHLITHRRALRYRNAKSRSEHCSTGGETEEVELAFDECWDDLPIAPFFVAEVENKTATEASFYRIASSFENRFPVIPTNLSKYLIVRKRQRQEPIQEITDLETGVRQTIRTVRALERKSATPIALFIGGGSASGKTELVAKKICKAIKGSRILSMDDCFYGPAWMKTNNRKNWDDPEAMDITLFHQWVLDLLDGKQITKKIYRFGKETDGAETINPPKVLIVEGIHALHETLDDIPGLRIFVDATCHCRFIRRMYRDALKGRTDQTPQKVFHQFFETVEPAHQQWIEPTKAKAHIVVQNTYNPLREATAIGKSDLQLKI